ncbi:MAG: hypothetical protein HYX34_11705 [Actinobacteria bacterium]|nr:hypothetical protein [Actinomycetota bacterium]
MKSTTNRRSHVSIFRASLSPSLQEWASRVEYERGLDAVLLPGAEGRFTNGRTFERIWRRAARQAGWPMNRKTLSGLAPSRPPPRRRVLAPLRRRLEPAVVAALLGYADAAFALSGCAGVRGDLSTTVNATTEELVGLAASSTARAQRRISRFASIVVHLTSGRT